MKLEKLFEELIKNKNDFVNARKGKEFEERIEAFLKRIGFSRILESDFDKIEFRKMKRLVQAKLEKNDIKNFLSKNKLFQNSFLTQPFGSQDYPDFIVFTDKYIIPIETKFSTNNNDKPVWNSNFPKANGFYIFGSNGKRDLTFFKGSDVLSMKERKMMVDYFDSLQEKTRIENKKIANINKFKTGFQIYVRRAFQQQKVSEDTEMSFLDNKKRVEREKKVINHIKKLT